MSKKKNTEQDIPEAVAALTRPSIPGEPILTIEEEAVRVMEAIAQQQQYPLPEKGTPEYERIHDDTVQFITQQRTMYRSKLLRAKQQLAMKELSFNRINIMVFNTIRGLREKFGVRVGDFIAKKGGGWLFEPSNDEVLQHAVRFASKSSIISYAKRLQQEMGETVVWIKDEEGNKTGIEREGWKEDLARLIAADLERVSEGIVDVSRI